MSLPCDRPPWVVSHAAKASCCPNEASPAWIFQVGKPPCFIGTSLEISGNMDRKCEIVSHHFHWKIWDHQWHMQEKHFSWEKPGHTSIFVGKLMEHQLKMGNLRYSRDLIKIPATLGVQRLKLEVNQLVWNLPMRPPRQGSKTAMSFNCSPWRPPAKSSTQVSNRHLSITCKCIYIYT